MNSENKFKIEITKIWPSKWGESLAPDDVDIELKFVDNSGVKQAIKADTGFIELFERIERLLKKEDFEGHIGTGKLCNIKFQWIDEKNIRLNFIPPTPTQSELDISFLDFVNAIERIFSEFVTIMDEKTGDEVADNNARNTLTKFLEEIQGKVKEAS